NLAQNLAIGAGDTVWLCTGATAAACDDPTEFRRYVYVNGVLTAVDNRALVLTFTPGNYAAPQWVYVYAVDAFADTVLGTPATEVDPRAEGDRVHVLQHSVLSSDARYDGLVVRNVEVTIRDNDTPGLLITEVTPGTSTQDDASLVIEGKNDPAAGGAYTGRNDEILVHLATDPGAGVTVVVGLILDAASAQAVIVSSADPRWNAADLTLTFTGGPGGTWDDAIRLLIRAADDNRAEDPQTAVLGFACASLGTCGAGSGFALANLRSGIARVDVTVIDNETPGVVLTQSGGSTIVIGDDPNTAADETLLITSQDSYTIRLTKRPDGTVTIAVLTDGLTDVVSIGGAPVVIAEIGQPDAGQWSGEATAAADPEPSDPSGLGGRRITRDDSSSWLADGFSEGQRVRVYNADNLAEFVDLKIAIIRGLNATFDETLQFTSEGVTPGWWATATAFDVVRLAAVATFDPTTWYAEQTVVLKADPLYSQPLVRQGSKIYPATTHLLSRIQGPLSVEGGVTGADRSLRIAVKLPGEQDGPSYSIASQAPESRQIDVLNIFNDSSRQNTSGVLTSTNLSGFGMAGDLTFEGSNPFGEPTTFPGGISFGSLAWNGTQFVTDGATSTIEVLNILLGQGNDHLDVQGTLNPAWGAPGGDTLSTGDPVIQAGGVAAGTATGGTLTRAGGSWIADGFVAGQLVMLSGLTGTWRVVAVSALVLTLEGATLAAATRTATVPGSHGGITVIHGGGNALLTLTGSMTGGAGSLTRSDGLAWSA
ncbi:MAG: hypothetical protein WBJ44_07080, partial [Propionicimonas sp.]